MHGDRSVVEGPMGPLMTRALLQGGGGNITAVPFCQCVQQIYDGGESPLLGLGLVFWSFFDLHQKPLPSFLLLLP
jgi:hypothetical protein